MWYIFNNDKKCVASCDSEPNKEDISAYGYAIIQSETIFDISKIELKDKIITVCESLVELKERSLRHLETEAQSLIPPIQAGIDTEINQQKLVDIMLQIEDLKGNL